MPIAIDQVRTRIQSCPLCSQEQDIVIRGHFPSPEFSDQVVFSEYNGYSFCNCRNIFFTDWKNMKQNVYNENYFDKYKSDALKQYYINNTEFYFKHLPVKDYKNFLEIGAINTHVLDFFKDKGLNTSGLDIHDHPLGEHHLIVSDFEKLQADKLFDIVWASHVFEHLEKPIEAVKKCNKILSEDGILYVGMPDTYFIDINAPDRWGHWHLFEHHILWDMNSFCELLEENGFRIIKAHRNTDIKFICTLDYGIVAQKVYDIQD